MVVDHLVEDRNERNAFLCSVEEIQMAVVQMVCLLLLEHLSFLCMLVEYQMGENHLEQHAFLRLMVEN